MNHSERPIDMLQRQLSANRAAIRYRNQITKRRHFCHLPEYREAFLKDVLAIRAAIKESK